MTEDGQVFEDHVVIVGWDEVSRNVTQRLRTSGREVAIITEEERHLGAIEEEFSESEVRAIHRHLTDYESFTAVNIENCFRIFVNLPSDKESLVAIFNLKKRYDDLEFVVVLSNRELEKTFETAGVSYVISPESVASKLVTSSLYEPDVARFEVDLLAGSGKEGCDVQQNRVTEEGGCDLQQYLITKESPFAGSTFGRALERLKDEFTCTPLGVAKRLQDGSFDVLTVPKKSLEIGEDDYLLVIAAADDESQLEELFGVKEGLRSSDE
jgi:voltage-gated potassium channel